MLIAACGGSGAVGPPANLDSNNLLADFEDPAAARLVETGSPARHGYWFPYNDMSAACTQMPAIGELYVPETPPAPSPKSGGLALHGKWMACDEFGAIVGVDLEQTTGDKGDYFSPNSTFDLSDFAGITFWGMGAPNHANVFRVGLTTTDETPPEGGGTCVEPADHGFKCQDSYGENFSLPTDGSWAQITLRFSDARFTQQGFGKVFAWNPAHVISVQVRSRDLSVDSSYDFWLDDFYLFK
jgi:hypothetical protein